MATGFQLRLKAVEPPGRTAFSPSLAKLANGTGDVNWVVQGDSTGNATDEFFYLVFQWLSTVYTAATFLYFPPGVSAGSYGAPVTVSTGSGSRVFRLYNHSFAGSKASIMQPSTVFTGSMVTPGRDWDLVLWNYGKNYNGYTQPAMQAAFTQALAQVQLAFPNANMVVTSQYRNQTPATYMDYMDQSWSDICALAPQIMRIPFYTGVFLTPDQYADDVHANALGNSQVLYPFVRSLIQNSLAGTWQPEVPWLSVPAHNYLDGNAGQQYANFALAGNGTLPGAVNSPATPADYVVQATMTFSQDASVTYGGAAISQRMIATAGNGARIYRNPSSSELAGLKGQTCIVTLLVNAEAGGASTMGRLGVLPNGTGGTGYTTEGIQGGWVVQCAIVSVPADATSFGVSFYQDSASPADTTHAVNLQWATCALGKLPRKAA